MVRRKKLDSPYYQKLELKNQYTKKMIGVQKILTGITNRSRMMLKDPTQFKTFDDMYSLLCNENLLIQAYGNIQKNKGSLTPGIDLETVDNMSLQKIKLIAKQLKDNTFTFSRTKRKWIPKLKIYKKGEPRKKRPLGIPTFKDRIVQEAIRIILESIYEPIFEMNNYNFGFRNKVWSPSCY